MMGPAIRWAAAAPLLLLSATAMSPFLSGHETTARQVVPTVRLIDDQGRPVTSDRLFGGRWSLLFLGFTSCQTVCPATLAQLVAVKRSLAQRLPAASQPQVVFVSVDPQRDTPARLASYLGSFDVDFVGATGDPAQIAALSDALTAFHQLRQPVAGGDYGVIHSGEVYLLDPAGRVRVRFSPPLDPDQIARELWSLTDVHQNR